MTRVPGLILCLVLAGACGPSVLPVLHPEVHAGPASAVRPSRVVVLPAACGSVEARCPGSYIAAVDAIVRGGLEFAGFALVEGEQLRHETRQRHEEHTSSSTSSTGDHDTTVDHPLWFDEHTHTTTRGGANDAHSLVVLDGPGFEDLSIDERHQVLVSSGADGVLVVRIVIGGQVGLWMPNQNVEVTVRLGADQGDVMVWAARCTASSNDFSTVDAALENAARCAIHGATGH